MKFLKIAKRFLFSRNISDPFVSSLNNLPQSQNLENRLASAPSRAPRLVNPTEFRPTNFNEPAPLHLDVVETKTSRSANFQDFRFLVDRANSPILPQSPPEDNSIVLPEDNSIVPPEDNSIVLPEDNSIVPPEVNSIVPQEVNSIVPPPIRSSFSFSFRLGIGGHGGRRPPRIPSGGGGNNNNFGPTGPNYYLLFCLCCLSLSYAIYQFFLQEFQLGIERELDKLQLEKEIQNLPARRSPAESEAQLQTIGNRSAVAFWQGRSWRLLKRGGLLVGSGFAGLGTFRRAFNLIVLPGLQRLSQAVIPPLFRIVLGPLITKIAEFIVFCIPSLFRIGFFFSILAGLKKLFLLFGTPDLVTPLVPTLTAVESVIRDCFAPPRGASISICFLEKQVKVVSCVLYFGAFSQNLLLLLQEEKENKFLILGCIGMFSVFIFFILTDKTYLNLYIQKLIQRVPSVQNVAQDPLGRVCIFFGTSILIQTFRFPRITNFVYVGLLYVSGLYQYIFSVNS